ncbi:MULTISPECIES: hypothetical protein [Olivibacter]|uniref:Uncharacterized protein n=2 Tax=Olivibacter TaxID=376469 RepID=A0ABV6HQK1_9SPHI|nr:MULTISPECIES: hypothetical protein [Olivibacter]MDX3917437.1 hypothetical protein [Pseudosphingobacterium sp.]QEL03940.1 hypothetical protein FKG96_24935 [Olivibacter sp. LS-1]
MAAFAKVRALDYQKQAATASAQQQERLLFSNFQNAINQYKQELQEFNYYPQKAVPNARDIASAAQLGYRTGDLVTSNIFTLWKRLQTYNSTI